MKGALAPTLLAALLVAGCDFDGAWESWCARTRCNETPPDAGSSLCEAGRGCPSGQACLYSSPGQGTCRPTCTGYAGGCGAGRDCKLLLAEDQTHLVPVCTALGTSTGNCSTVEDCVELRTCAAPVGSAGFACLEMCNPYHPDCVLDVPAGSDAGVPAPTCFNDGTLPDGWGVCAK